MAKTKNNVLIGIGLVILLAMSTFSVLAFVEQLNCKDLYSEQENFGMCGDHSNKKKGTSEGYGGHGTSEEYGKHKKKKEEGYGGHGTSEGYGGRKKKKEEGYGGHGCGDHSNKKKGTSEGYGERKKKKGGY